MKMSLDQIKKGKQQKPLRLVVAGVEGVGKSTFASMAPSPVFLCPEDGVSHIDTASFPTPSTLDEVYEAIECLYSQEHGFKTIVVDSADWMESIIRDHVIERQNKNSIEEIPYGKGWVMVQEQYIKLLRAFDALYNKGMNIVIIAHVSIKPFNDPTEEAAYDRYQLKLDKKTEPLLKEWCDIMLFCNFDTNVEVKKNRQGEIQGKAKAKSYGKRLAYTKRTAAYDAKDRFGLPDRLPLDWDAFAQAFTDATGYTIN